MTFLEQILRDKASSPTAFHFYGPMPPLELAEFLAERNWKVPSELFMFWTHIGGMDMFADEILYGPVTHYSWQDGLDDYNVILKEAKKDKDYVLIHQGIGNTMIDQKTMKIKVFGSKDFGRGKALVFDTCLEWYTDYLREEYWRDYGLPERIDPCE